MDFIGFVGTISLRICSPTERPNNGSGTNDDASFGRRQLCRDGCRGRRLILDREVGSDAARRALDDLFTNARQFNSSSSYFELMQFIGRFRFTRHSTQC